MSAARPTHGGSLPSSSSALPGPGLGDPIPRHVMWGEPELDTSHTSNSSSQSQSSNVDGSQSGKKTKKIVNAKLTVVRNQGVQILQESSTDGSASGGKPAQEANPANAVDEAEASSGAADALPSVGSANHGSGKCKPCMFLTTPMSCARGYDCAFCHAAHDRFNTPRPCKGKRDRFKKLVKCMELRRQNGEEPGAAAQEGAGEEASPSTKQSL
mmetsp:Transcript_49637/g.111599  ORF Transcript_49637/g.111599 Transcript_49637/m.111599 type:complete len:213 (+) Transcript_49637:137-775(+)